MTQNFSKVDISNGWWLCWLTVASKPLPFFCKIVAFLWQKSEMEPCLIDELIAFIANDMRFGIEANEHLPQWNSWKFEIDGMTFGDFAVVQVVVTVPSTPPPIEISKKSQGNDIFALDKKRSKILHAFKKHRAKPSNFSRAKCFRPFIFTKSTRWWAECACVGLMRQSSERRMFSL